MLKTRDWMMSDSLALVERYQVIAVETTRQIPSVKDSNEEQRIDHLTEPILRGGAAQSQFSDTADTILSNLLRKEKVKGLVKKIDGFMNMVKEHRVIGALSLLNIDLPIACPAAIGTAVKLYNLTLTPQMLLALEIADTLALFSIEYMLVNGVIVAYDKTKHRFLSKDSNNTT
jgi:hypothetical protein